MKLIKNTCQELKKYRKYMVFAAKSQLKSEVASSYLNWLWWIIEPLCMMIIYSLVFGKIFGMREDYFNIFIFLGLAIWDFFNRCVKGSIKLVKRNKAIVTKVYIPKYILLISEMIVNTFKMLICLGICFFMILIDGAPLSINVLYIIPILIITELFTFGVCTYLLHFGVFVEDLANIMNIILRFMFYFTGIFYSIGNKFPAPYNDILLKIHPIALLIDMLRNCTIYCKSISWEMLLIWFLVSVVLSLLGIRRIKKSENTYVKVI